MQDLAGLAAAATQMTSKPHSTLTAPSPQDLTCYFQPAHGACPAEVLAESELQVSFRARPESPPTWGAEGATLTALCAQFTANFQLEHPWDIPERFRVCAPTPTPLSHTISAASASCELGVTARTELSYRVSARPRAARCREVACFSGSRSCRGQRFVLTPATLSDSSSAGGIVQARLRIDGPPLGMPLKLR